VYGSTPPAANTAAVAISNRPLGRFLNGFPLNLHTLWGWRRTQSCWETSGLIALVVPDLWISNLPSHAFWSAGNGRLTCSNCRDRCRFCIRRRSNGHSAVHRWSLAPRRSTHLYWTCACTHPPQRSKKMLWTICLILLVLWALGLATSYTAGGLIHILLVVAVVVMVFRLIQGRRIV